VLRPLVRLALATGLKHPQLEAVLRELLVDEARDMLAREGVRRPNISQLSTLTGLNRKDITARVRAVTGDPAAPPMSPASMVFTRWLQMAKDEPALRRLPIKGVDAGPTFESLAREGSRGNVHHRSVLDDLVRLGMVTEVGDTVELTSEGFIPANDLQGMLEFVAQNGRDHLQAAVNNTLGVGPRMLERSVFADGLSEAEGERVHLVTREAWAALHHRLVDELTIGVAKSGPDATHRIKIGIYVLHEDAADGANPPADASPTPIPPASKGPL
jgi:Family of unknown function (DUF6502)